MMQRFSSKLSSRYSRTYSLQLLDPHTRTAKSSSSRLLSLRPNSSLARTQLPGSWISGAWRSGHQWWETIVLSLNWRCLLCAGIIFLWDRERITNAEAERCYNRYHRYYLPDSPLQSVTSEDEQQIMHSSSKLTESASSDITGAFVESEENASSSNSEISQPSVSSDKSNSTQAEDKDSVHESSVHESKSRVRTVSSPEVLNDDTPDDIDSKLDSRAANSKDSRGFWSRLVGDDSVLTRCYNYVWSYVSAPSTHTLSAETEQEQKEPVNNESLMMAEQGESGSPVDCSTEGEEEGAVLSLPDKETGDNSKQEKSLPLVEGATDEICESPSSKSPRPVERLQEEREDVMAGWEFMFEQGGCKVYSKLYKDTGMYQYKVVGSYDDITARDFIEVQTNIEDRKTWDTYAIKLETIDRDPRSGSEVVHWVLKYPFPMSSREYVFVRRTWISANDDAIVLINRSIDHPLVPETRKFVRVKTYFSEMTIKPTTFIDELGFHYEVTYFDDPGVYLPSSAISWVSKSAMPDFLNKMHTAALRKNSYSTQRRRQSDC